MDHTQPANESGFVKTCILCGCHYAVFSEPIPLHYHDIDFAHRISQAEYEARIEKVKQGVCAECAPAPCFDAFTHNAIFEMMLEAENRKLAHTQAQKHISMESLVTEFGEEVRDIIPREERFIKHCEAELIKRGWFRESSATP